MTWSDFNDSAYVPDFYPNGTAVYQVTDEEAETFCGNDSSACQYDYLITQDQSFAAATLASEELAETTAAAAATTGN